MKQGIHPTYYSDAQVICACGNTWTTGSTRKQIRTDVCSACHPFFTGEQRIVDTAGQVDRFMRRLQQAEERAAQVQVQQKAEEAARKAAAQARARGESPKKAKQIAERAAEDVIASMSPGKEAVAIVVETEAAPVETGVESVVEAADEPVEEIKETVAQ
jgi:large subunit ribosomal protein L31